MTQYKIKSHADIEALRSKYNCFQRFHVIETGEKIYLANMSFYFDGQSITVEPLLMDTENE